MSMIYDESFQYPIMDSFASNMFNTPSFRFDDAANESPPSLQPFPYSFNFNSDLLVPCGILVSESPSMLYPHPDIRSGEHTTLALDVATKMRQDPSSDLALPYTPLDSTTVNASSHILFPLLAGRSCHPQNSCATHRMVDLEQESQASLQARHAQGSTPGYSCRNEDRTWMVDDGAQSPVKLYHRLEDRSIPCRRFSRACAINVEGIWVDKDDLYHGIGQGQGAINVHQCRWATSGNPCGMWIVASRSRVGAHIKNWHSERYREGVVTCLWGGCMTNRTMHKDSINRHIVTVHLRESFRCNGCSQEFSRKDVYDRHVMKAAHCRDLGASMVYGTEYKVIGTQQALRGGGAVRYAT